MKKKFIALVLIALILNMAITPELASAQGASIIDNAAVDLYAAVETSAANDNRLTAIDAGYPAPDDNVVTNASETFCVRDSLKFTQTNHEQDVLNQEPTKAAEDEKNTSVNTKKGKRLSTGAGIIIAVVVIALLAGLVAASAGGAGNYGGNLNIGFGK